MPTTVSDIIIAPIQVLRSQIKEAIRTEVAERFPFRLSPSVTMICEHLNAVGNSYLEQYITPIILNIVNRNILVEIVPERITDGQSLEECQRNHIALCDYILEAVIQSIPHVPEEVFFVCAELREAVYVYAYQEHEAEKKIHSYIISLILLRFLMSGCQFMASTVADTLSAQEAARLRRTGILILSSLQLAALQISTSKKEPYRQFQSDWILSKASSFRLIVSLLLRDSGEIV